MLHTIYILGVHLVYFYHFNEYLIALLNYYTNHFTYIKFTH